MGHEMDDMGIDTLANIVYLVDETKGQDADTDLLIEWAEATRHLESVMTTMSELEGRTAETVLLEHLKDAAKRQLAASLAILNWQRS